MMKRALLIFAAIIGACSGPGDAPQTERRTEALELPPVGQCTTLTGDLRLNGQADVQTFGDRTCTTVDGSMLVTGATDLSPLADLTTVTGVLHIRGNQVTDLTGLAALASVDELILDDNPVLVSAALPALANADRLRVVGNPELTTFTADALTTTDSVDLRALPELSNLSFAALQLIGGDLHIIGTKLLNLSGLSALNSVGSLVISNNDVLLDLDDLAALASVASDLVIRQNDRLGGLGGLTALISVGGRVAITANPLLLDLSLSALTISDELMVHNNPLLTSTGTLNGSYRADLVYIKNNAQLSDVSNLPLGMSSDLIIERSNGLTSLDTLGAVTLRNAYFRDNAALGATTVPVVAANFIEFRRNSSSSASFPSLAGSSGLSVGENSNLVALSFDALTGIDIDIFENFALETLSFQQAGTAVDFDIVESPALTTVTAPNLVTVTDDLRYINTGVTDLSGIPGLQSVADDYELLDNASLLDVSGMESLVSVGDGFNVSGNVNLTSLSEFTSLSSVTNFTVQNNTSMRDCQATDLAALVTISGTTTIMNNGGPGGCP